ncbi:DUF3311 domain-containing protein [Bacillus sp. ISL-4]|uniref:DUF3311 domain-containing protein n=1 Tax=Peribacillus butanolivorans TaxID=421767 RepID=A0AAX0RQR8_9BACI|nr:MULTISPECIES: DUF3311 domain-containing protein [Bacillaceae]MBT2667956.1 DUF3311 domain-containing protein [Bacillus sp. ISL-4]MBT2672718.1 DUF3311 domain-containing protein [Streptomyces sp. ISL-14]PEJ28314.1 hypothetical protein CN689_22435 [Peribacillus butanolivorans]
MKKICILLSVIPFIGSLTVINRVEPYVLGLPFILFWSVSWVVLTAVFLGISNVLYPADEGDEE